MNKEILYDKPRIVICHDFLTPEECKDIIDGVPLSSFFPATGYDTKTGTGIKTDFRTNATYVDNDYRLISVQQRLTKFIEDELEGNSSYSKGCIETPLQVQRYALKQQYKSHIDFFNGPVGPKYFEVDRIASAIIYLNDDFEGGETFFSSLSIDVKPRVGSLLFFRYDYNEFLNNANTLHTGLPVVSGVKYIITAFVRSEPISTRWNPKVPE